MDSNTNIFKGSETANYILPTSDSSEQTITLVSKTTGGSSFDDLLPTMNVYLIEDGVPIEFKTSVNDVYNISQSIGFTPNKEDETDLTFKTNNNSNVLTLLRISYPDAYYDGKFQPLDTATIYTMFNEDDSNIKNREIDESNYITMTKPVTTPLISIGVEQVDAESNNIEYNDNTAIDISDDTQLYVKYNSGEYDYPYYVLIAVDGQLMKAFDGEYSIYVDCNNGERTFQYALPLDIIPQGKHTVQMFALMAERDSQGFDYQYNDRSFLTNVNRIS